MKCTFCQIIKQEKKPYIVGENEKSLAILDVQPASDGHTLLITKEHFVNISEINEKSWNCLLPLMKEVINKLQVTFQPSGFNIISNMNEIASQSIFHLHIHVIPKYEKNEGFIWTTKPILKYSLDQTVEKLQVFLPKKNANQKP